MSATPEQEKVIFGHDTAIEGKKEPEAAPMGVTMTRAQRRERQQIGRRIIKKVRKGHSPRQIAHSIGYLNVNQGEEEVRKFISVVNNRG